MTVVGAGRQSETTQHLIEVTARRIPGEGAASGIRTLQTWRQTDNQKPRRKRADSINRCIVPMRVAVTISVAKAAKARTFATIG